MRSVRLELTLNERVVFSQRGATEGDHKTLDYIPGSTLLGWAASRLYSKYPADITWHLFHSGAVRFSNGYPITHSGCIAFPIPQIISVPKNSPAETDTCYLPDDALIEMHRTQEERDLEEKELGKKIQREPLKFEFLAGDLSKTKLSTNRRLKTAVKDNKAADGSLFGYSHIEAGTVFVATVEIDNQLPSDVQEDLLSCFNGELLLGRSRRSEYGGRVGCVVNENAPDPFPATKAVSSQGLMIWALSDLCVLDQQNGLPTASPTLSDLFPGMELKGTLNRKASAVGHRRYAPWNGYLQCRETERCVIQAGSVLCYDCCEIDNNTLPNITGLYQEAGLGRIWINPKILVDKIPKKDPGIVPLIDVQDRKEVKGAVWPKELAGEGQVIVGWLRNQAASRDTGNLDKQVAVWVKELKQLYKSAIRMNGNEAGPSRSQWGAVQAAAHKAHNVAELRQVLFAKGNSICGSDGASEDRDAAKSGWLSRGRVNGQLCTFRDWLENKLSEDELRNKAQLSDEHVLLAVPLLVKTAQSLAEGKTADAA